MYRPNNRRQSLSDKDKTCKKSPKKKKKGKKCLTKSVEGVDQNLTESDRSQQSHSADTSLSKENNGINGSRFPSLHQGQADRKTSPKGVTGVSLVITPCVGSVGAVTESKSVNTDLSESTISLVSSTGNSQTDLPGPTVVSRAYCTPVETLIQSMSALNVKARSPGLQTVSPRNSRTNKSQQRSQGNPNSSRKSSGTGKHKSSNSAHNSKNGNQKLKQVDEKTDKSFPKTAFNFESQRWESTMEDPAQEAERLNIYKINRRKRYIAAAEAKGLQWALEYNESGCPVTPVSPTHTDNLIYESKRIRRSPERTSPAFSTVHSLTPVTVHTVSGKMIVEC